MNYILIITGLVLVVIVTIIFIKSNEKSQKDRDYHYYVDVPLKYMIDFNPVTLNDIEKKEHGFEPKYFLFEVLCLFKEAQKAWSEMNLVKLKNYLGNDLYTIYEKVIQGFFEKGHRNMIYDIQLLNSKLCSYNIEKDKTVAEVLMTVSCYDYLVATSSQRIITGNNERKLAITYLLTLEKTKTSKEKDIICTNCKQEIEGENLIRCPFCNNELVPTSFDIVITNKKVLKETEF